MKILAIDTSCDETACAVTNGTKILSNIIWSQASAHAQFGGVFPSLAQRMHEERISFVVNKALAISHQRLENIDAIAVTIGPGLSIALGVGVNKAKELAKKYSKPLIPINHIEAHILSPFANYKLQITNYKFPILGLCLSGGNTILVKINKIGDYETLAKTTDDALGEALDKGARMLGLGYPGGPILEKFAKLGDSEKYGLPVPLINDKEKNRFSYSGLKTAMMRKIEELRVINKELSKEDIYNLSASFQNSAFKHIENVLEYQISNSFSDLKSQKVTSLLFGGGVANNIEIRKRIRKICRKYKFKLLTPYSKRLNGDNAGMIGVTAYLKYKNLNAKKLNAKFGGEENINSIDRNPNLMI